MHVSVCHLLHRWHQRRRMPKSWRQVIKSWLRLSGRKEQLSRVALRHRFEQYRLGWGNGGAASNDSEDIHGAQYLCILPAACSFAITRAAHWLGHWERVSSWLSEEACQNGHQCGGNYNHTRLSPRLYFPITVKSTATENAWINGHVLQFSKTVLFAL